MVAMARASFLQPARASLVDDWVSYVREEFPERSEGVDIAAFAGGHIQGYSVTAEVFTKMAYVKPIIYDAWAQIFTWGRAPVEWMVDVCQQVQEIQGETE